jgi:putative protease
VLSMKDNNQSANLRALIDAGVRSFKIEGRYKDMGYVKNITAHYRKLLDEIIEERESARASSGRTTFSFTPDPDQNFNREFTDYFVNGRKDDIGAFDTPKTGPRHRLGDPGRRQVVRARGQRQGHRAAQRRRPVLLRPAKTGGRAHQPRRSVAPRASGASSPRTRWPSSRTCARAWRSTATATWTGCARWRKVQRPPHRPVGRVQGDRRRLCADADRRGRLRRHAIAQAHQAATDAAKAEATLREQLGRFGATIFECTTSRCAEPALVRARLGLNQLRRDAVAA